MTPLRVVTVDDEALARERVSDLVRATQDLELVGEGANGLEALDLITNLHPDLVFIDVEMPELSGFGVIAALPETQIPGVVFVTAFEHYALQAFEVGAIDYLHKPITKARFAAAVARSKDRLARHVAGRHAVAAHATRLERERGFRTRFVIRREQAHVFVPVSDVDWVDVADNYLQLHAGSRTHLCRGTMNELAQELDPARFVRIHRSIVVAVDRIASVRARASGGYAIVLRTGVVLNSSRRYAGRVRALLSKR
jgi:two-component system, LytTR family, response regulator